MYQALYRKYRSQTFGEMVGQNVISTTLKQAVNNHTISHAYLFSGPRGTGKTSAAKIFAKAMNCPNQKDGEPCNDCYICQAITNGSLEDVIEIDAASNNGVDEIRDIRDKSTYAPSSAEYKVYIIDEVHMLSTGAFNALLKTLEEPTENVVFILATTELHKIPATILSRVQRFEFKSIKLKDIVNHLESILSKEGINFEERALEIISRRAEGGMRDALSILDQALSLSQGNDVTTEIAEEITGSISLASLDQYVMHVRVNEATDALSDLETIFDNGKSMSRFVTDLLNYLRDVLVVQSGGDLGQASQLFNDNLALNQERIFYMIEEITKALDEIKRGTHPKIYTEMLTIRLAQPYVADSLSTSQEIPENVAQEIKELRTEVGRLKQELKQFSDGASVKKVSSNQQSRRSSGYKVDKEKILTIMQETLEDSEKSRQYLDSLQTNWNEILDSITPQDRVLLHGSEPVLANSEHAILAFDYSFNAEQVMSRQNLNDIFGNIMSSAAGFSPDILAVPRKIWQEIRQEFAAKVRQNQNPNEEKTDDELIVPEEMAFLKDKVTIEED